ncbi:major capsid protein E [Peribacillus muralis]|uniref:Major capsid protein E n=1 Tax=Peribacillus muralis TaxID=264697 RepID=A0A1B3XMP6_9BACI|nr:major capsid protein [Peribacillus muralis]AOH54481.1 major capsid protein E [Peribacillus muralis]
MPTIAELFSKKELITYMMNRQYPTLLGEQLFPEVKRDTLEFDQIKGASRVPVIASVHAFDTEAEIGSREASRQALELAYVKRKMQLKEKDLYALQRPRDAKEQQYLTSLVYNDIDQMAASLRARAEAMRMEALAKGIVTLEGEKGNLGIVDYQVPSANKQALSGTSLWTDPTSDPLNDILRWGTTLNGMGTRALTSTAVLQTLLRHPKVLGAIYGQNSGRVLSVSEFNAWMQQQNLPTIATYDQVYRKQQANGTYVQNRYFPLNSFVMFGNEALGETIYGPTPEELRLINDPSVDTSNIGNLYAMVYESGLDPVGTWKKVSGVYLPSFPAADEVFQATVI